MYQLAIDYRATTTSSYHATRARARAALYALLDSSGHGSHIAQARADHTTYLLTEAGHDPATAPVVGVASIEPAGATLGRASHVLTNPHDDVWHLNRSDGQFITAVQASSVLDATARAQTLLTRRGETRAGAQWHRRGPGRYALRAAATARDLVIAAAGSPGVAS